MLRLTYSNLIASAVHIGHTIKNTLFMSAWMLFSVRQNIWIINLFKTIYMFKIGFKCIKDVVSKNGPIWFINLDKSVERYIKFNANKAGEFFICNHWCKGIVSNYKEVQKSFRALMFQGLISVKYNNNKFPWRNWFFTRFSWPRFLFVSNVSSCPSAVTEALNLGICCLAIVDTNINSQAVNIAVPGNDESLHSIIFYNELICNYVLLCKFKSVILWFINIRNSLRLNCIRNFLYVKLNNSYKFNFNSHGIFFKSLRYVLNTEDSLDKNRMFPFSNKTYTVTVKKVSHLFSQNLRLFGVLSRWYSLKHAVNKNAFFRGLNKSRKWRRNRFLFWKVRLRKLILRNVKFGFSTLKFFWRFINRGKFLRFIKKDLWFTRMWSSYFLGYISLFNQVYCADIDEDLSVEDLYKIYLKKVPWFIKIILSRRLRNWYFRRRFLKYLNFTSFFFFFKSSLFYYLSFPLKKLNSFSNEKNGFQKDIVSMLLLSKSKVSNKKKILIKHLDKSNVKVFRLGSWSFDKIVHDFYWEKIVDNFVPLIVPKFLFFFEGFLKYRANILLEYIYMLKSIKIFFLKKFKWIMYV